MHDEPIDTTEAGRRRLINQDRVRIFGGDAGRAIVFLCECADASCSSSVVLSADEFATRVATGARLTAVGHDAATSTTPLA